MQLGECRRFVFADLLCRYLEYRDYAVDHVINITDLDDKTINGSEAAGESLSEFTRKHIDAFKTELALLNVRPAEKYPLTSDHVDDMVSLTSELVKKGFAYEKLRSLYFDISRFADYGRLSGIDINKIKLGATVDLDEYEKDNPRDFTLLKRSKLSELKRGIYVKSEWGNVRPSWHIQCAAVAMKYLGDSFDIHASGRELVFPHHENEIAIATAISGKPLARYWLHCDQVRIDQGWMDQGCMNRADNGGDSETGNHLTLKHLTDFGFSGRVIRFWLLSSHYRKPLTLSFLRLDNARRSLDRLDACIGNLRRVQQGAPYPERDQLLYDIKQNFIRAMDDDLNISAAMASIFKAVKRINILIREKRIDPEGASRVIEAFRSHDNVLKIMDFQEGTRDQRVEDLKAKRRKARLEKNWGLADKIRKQLLADGVIVTDEKMKKRVRK
jgi:cysteinyl-tRNA synthetase